MINTVGSDTFNKTKITKKLFEELKFSKEDLDSDKIIFEVYSNYGGFIFHYMYKDIEKKIDKYWEEVWVDKDLLSCYINKYVGGCV
jgi:hypothetical protein